MIPLLWRALVLVLGVCGIPLGEAEGALIQQADRIEAILCQLQTALEFLFQLIGAEDQMTLGDRELTHADQAVHLAGILVAEERRGFAQTHGQVAVGALTVEIHLILEGAGHGTQREAFLRFVVRVTQHEHTVQIVIPVTGNLIKLTLGHERGLGQKIALLLLNVLHPALQQLNDARALRQQNGQALTDTFDGREVFQLTAELIVVALDRLCLLGQIFVQLVLLREGNAVDSLEHFALGIAAPVGSTALRELEGVGLDASGGVQLRAGAEVCELALGIERNDGILRQIVDQLDLVRLAEAFHIGDCLRTRLLGADKGQALLADLLHLGLNGVQMLLREGEIGIKVIVPAVVDGRADGQLDLRIQALDRLRHHMGAGMPIGLAVSFVFKGVQIFFGHGVNLLT